MAWLESVSLSGDTRLDVVPYKNIARKERSMTCELCGLELVIGSWPFCRDGHAPATQLFNVISDEIPGGFVQEHFGPTPETFYSKSEMARRAKELGLTPFVRHVGEQGSDKSSKTSRWV